MFHETFLGQSEREKKGKRRRRLTTTTMKRMSKQSKDLESNLFGLTAWSVTMV